MDKYNSLTINGITYEREDLLNFANAAKVKDSFNHEAVGLLRFIKDWLDDQDFITVKTSGSTGNPTQIKIQKKHMIESASQTGEFLRLKRNDQALMCLPIDFIAGKMMVVRAFVLGLDLFPVSPSGNPLKNTIRKFAFAALTPMQFANTLMEPKGKQKLQNIDKLILGGSEIPAKHLPAIRELDNETWHTYGMTETITHVAMKRLNGENQDIFFNALAGVQFSIDERGCLVIDSQQRGIKNLVTNDRVNLISNTAFEYLGRNDFVINSGGIKLSPEAIEAKLSEQIKQNFILGSKPDQTLGHRLVLILETGNDIYPDLSKLALKARLNKFETPKEVILIEQFPLTPSGKIDRLKILDRLK